MDAPSERTPRRMQRALSALVGLAISAALLWWAARDVNIGDVLAEIRRVAVAPLVFAIIVATLTFPLRLVRWRLLLRDESGAALPSAPLWHAIAIGFMANNILPFRAGELIRVFTVTRLTKTRLSSAVSSVAVERIFDGLTVVGLLTVALFASGLPTGLEVAGVSVARAAQVAGGIALTGLAGAIAVVVWPTQAERIARRLVRHPTLAARVIGLITGLRHGLTALASPARLAGVIAWSLVLWLVNALAFYLCFDAFGIDVPYVGALLLQGLLVLGIAVPSTPGGVGPFEAAIVAALGLYGVPSEVAFSYAITFHLTTFIPLLLLGAWSLAHTPLRLRDLRRPTS